MIHEASASPGTGLAQERPLELDLRAAYVRTLTDLAAENRNILVLEADLARSSGTDPGFRSMYPDRFVQVGIAEANMIGIAAGLALEGKIPFCSSFTAFATRRVYDQIAISVALANVNVKIVGVSPGIANGPNGSTHICFEDMAIMRAIPDMVILSPCDAYEVRSCVRWMADYRGPVYLQLIRSTQPTIFDGSYEFKPGRAVRIREGKDVTLVSTGYATQFAVRAADELASEGVAVDLLHYTCVKPFDAVTLVKSARVTGRVVTVENQNIIGGLGGTVCETLSETFPVPVKRLGVPDTFGEVGTERYLSEVYGFSVEHIKSACQTFAMAAGGRGAPVEDC